MITTVEKDILEEIRELKEQSNARSIHTKVLRLSPLAYERLKKRSGMNHLKHYEGMDIVVYGEGYLVSVSPY